ncbi:M1 family metallopeptidase [Mangrovibacterium lignilyticum]|uniref:M1 family metallopeptidase n=1 Tax=Mangrovibacterium lignilyticum TaxID=2668052 RepID=UPI0013D80E21|nr:M1 family aminopeptidase [Mangrovibacterium lignilyticum]
MNRYLLFIFLFIMACQTTTLKVEPGISQTLADWRSANLSQVNYQLTFQIPADRSEAITGTVLATFQLSENSDNLQFDFKGKGAEVHQVMANGTEIPVHFEEEHVVVASRFLEKGENKVEISFTSPDQSLNRNDEFLYTLFVPDRASTAFPCFDQPNLKAKFTLQLDVPSDWKAVANAPVEKVEQHDSETIHYFAQTEPLPTYLFAFVAGQFETVSREHNNRLYTLYHRESSPAKVENNLDDIFNLLFLSVDSIENYTDIPYPFAKYDLVVVPSFQYGGMEHPGVTLYRDSRMFLEGKPTPKELLDRANLIAHETSHMWFGDLVTMPWFDEVWLKEVYANFIADKVTSPLFPEFNQDLLFLMAHQDAAYSVDRTTGTNPVTQPLTNLKDAGSLYGSIIYHKAPVVMGMLENRIGKEALQKGLQKYLKNYSYGNAGWDELIALLDQDGTLKDWSHVWVEEAGRPQLKGEITNGNLVIDQLDPQGNGRIWQQNIDVVWPQGDSLVHQQVRISQQETILKSVLPKDGVDWFYLNGNGKAYGFIEIDQATQNYLSANLSAIPDVLLRASAWIDLHENMLEGTMQPLAFAIAIIQNLPTEKDQVLYERMLNYLSGCYQYNLTESEKDSLQQRVEDLITDQLAIHPERTNALSNAAIQLFRTPKGLNVLYTSWEQKTLAGSPLTITQLTNLSLVLALHLPEKETSILDEQEARLENPDMKARFQFIRPAVSPDEEIRDSVFQSFAQVANRDHEPWVQTALFYLNHPGFSVGREKYIEPGLALLPEIQQTGDIFFPQGWVSSLLRGHKSAEAAEIVRRFLAENPDFPEPLRLKVLQAADDLLKQHPASN